MVPRALRLLLLGACAQYKGWVAQALLPNPQAKAKLSFGGAESRRQDGFVHVIVPEAPPDGEIAFATTFQLGARTAGLAVRGARGVAEDAGPTPPDVVATEDEAIEDLLTSSLVCRVACVMTLDFDGLLPGKRYRFVTYHHSNVGPRGGCPFTLQYSGNSVAPLRQGGESWRRARALWYAEVARADADGRLTLEVRKGPISANAPMNLNGLEISEVSEKFAELVAEHQFCGHVDHKDFGELLDLHQCTDAVDGDQDCADHFSWCPSFRGRCKCATKLGNAPDCGMNASFTDGTVRSEMDGCNVYRTEEAITVYWAPEGSAECLHGSSVSQASCLAAIRELLGPDRPIKADSMRSGAWGAGDKLQPPHGCSLHSDGTVFHNKGKGTIGSSAYTLVCLGLSQDVAANTSGDPHGSCLPGYFNPDRLGECEQCVGGATRRRRAETCSQCPAGYYDPGNVDDCVKCQGGATRRRRASACTDCAPGLYDALDGDDCDVCRGGSVRRRRSVYCEECPAGWFWAPGSDDCQQCHGGHSRRRRATECTPCPSGYYSQPGADDCSICSDSTAGECRLPS